MNPEEGDISEGFNGEKLFFHNGRWYNAKDLGKKFAEETFEELKKQ